MHDEGNPNIDTTAAGTTAGSESEAAKGSAENAAGQGQQAEPQGEMTAEAVAALVQRTSHSNSRHSRPKRKSWQA